MIATIFTSKGTLTHYTQQASNVTKV